MCTYSDALTKAESGLKETVAWLITTYRITDYKVIVESNGRVNGNNNNNSGSGGNSSNNYSNKSLAITTALNNNEITDTAKLIEVLRNCVTWLLEARDVEIRDKMKSLLEKEQEMVSLRRILVSFESSDSRLSETVVGTPIRGSGALNDPYANALTVASLNSKGEIPATPAHGHGHKSSSSSSSASYLQSDELNNSLVALTPSGSAVKHPSNNANSSVRWSGAKAVLSGVSPAAKQAAKLQSEILKEV